MQKPLDVLLPQKNQYFANTELKYCILHIFSEYKKKVDRQEEKMRMSLVSAYGGCDISMS